MIKCRFFRISKLTTDSSLAYDGFCQLASIFDFKYRSVLLKLIHCVITSGFWCVTSDSFSYKLSTYYFISLTLWVSPPNDVSRSYLKRVSFLTPPSG